jgi:chitodextrinase
LQQGADQASVLGPTDTEVGSIIRFQPRRIAVAASFVTLACIAGIATLPLVAHGDDAPAAPAVAQALLDARDEVAATNEYAHEMAPLAIGSSCGPTIDVPGIGDTCRTRDGLLRVELEDGSSATIHGLDAPPLSAASYTPASSARVGAASRADIDCVGADQPHYVLVYARPANVGSRYATIAPKLRQEAYKMSAFLDSESQSVDPDAGRHMPFVCDADAPRVLDLAVPAVGSGGVDFNALVEDLRADGLAFNDPSGNERYAVFVDASSATGASGTGHVFSNDSRPGADNQNNRGGLYAVQYRYDGADEPVWSTLLHEIGHTMGAVVNDAPNASGIGHCHDDQDIMCYADGSRDDLYRPNVCAVEVFDCKRDDYYNPAPAAGSYLATHWNVAGTANRWLDRRLAGDQSAPTPPTGLSQTGASNNAVGLAWNAASDDVAVTGYEVTLIRADGSAAARVSTARRTAAITGLAATTSYTASVVALDARGHRSAALTGTVATSSRADTSKPSKPGRVRYKVSRTAVVITWNDAKDNVGVDAYAVYKLSLRGIRSAPKPVRALSYKVSTRGMVAGRVYSFQIAARDTAGNYSAPVTVKVRLAKDKVRPTAPKALRVVKRASNRATVKWGASRDAVGVTKYVAYRKVGSRWRALRSMKPKVTMLTVTGLRGHGSVVVRVAAFDAAGNKSFSRAVRLAR